MVSRQLVPLQTPEQQCEFSVHGSRIPLHALSQSPPRQRRLQQSTSVVHAPPGSAQVATQREEKSQRFPAQHQ